MDYNSKRDFYQYVYTIFKSDLINNMDHMRISGTEQSSVILSQTKLSKRVKSDAKNCQKKVKPKGMVL